ncbi:MAG: DUF1700 domain-containing protein [Clostridiales bacterium]|jgi:hypothetical protein|nr:DUF1700 domain-containing protein [Clostridiales bacterium]
MNKHEYLARLRKSLRRRFEPEEIGEILTDYDGFFAEAIAEGKTEAQISAELGEPGAVAAELAEAFNKKRRILPLSVDLRQILFLVGLLALAISYYALTERVSYPLFARMAGVGAFAMLFWLIMRKGLRKAPRTMPVLHLIFAHSLLLAIGIFIHYFPNMALWYFFNAIRVVDVEVYATTISLIMRAFLVSMAFALVASVHGLRRSPYFFAIGLQSVITAAFIADTYAIFGNLQDAMTLRANVALNLELYGHALLFVILAYPAIRLIIKRRCADGGPN